MRWIPSKPIFGKNRNLRKRQEVFGKSFSLNLFPASNTATE